MKKRTKLQLFQVVTHSGIILYSCNYHPFIREGLLQGAPYGVIRVGDINGPYQIEEDGAMFPGAAMKFFKNGMPSGNLLVAPNHSQFSGNFFEQRFTNQLNPALPRITEGPKQMYWRSSFLFQKFGEFATPLGKNAGLLGLTNLATHTFDGETVPEEEISSPRFLIVEANEAIKDKFTSVELGADLLESTFSQIPPGTTLYEIFATDDLQSTPELIGRINTRSEFVDTLFGDTQLRFAHEFTDLNPGLVDSISQEMLEKIGCPFLKTRASVLKNKQLLSIA